jgi:aryl carrier-like protein
MTVRLAVKQVKKVAKLAELEGVDRSTVLRDLIDIGLDSPQVTLLMRRPGAKGRGVMGSIIRAVAANERVKVTQSALMRAPSVEAEVRALRAEEEQAEAMAAFDHHQKTSRYP